MRIRFETTIDDVIAFQCYHSANSPAWRRQVWTQSLLGPAIGLAMLLLLRVWSTRAIDADNLAEAFLRIGWFDVVAGLFIFFASIFWVVFIRWHMTASLVRNTRKFLAEGSNRIMFGWREMELVDGRLVLHTELLQSSLDMRAIEKIVGDGNYTFVYIASVSAYMIPMNRYPEDEYGEFVAELREAWDKRDTPKLAKRPVDEGIIEKSH